MTYTLIKQLDEQRRSSWEQAKSLLERAESEKRDLTAAEQEAYERHTADIDALRSRIDDYQTRDREQRAAAERAEQLLGRSGSPYSAETNALNTVIREAVRSRSMAPIDVDPGQRRSGFQPGIERRALATSSGSGMLGTTFYDRLLLHAVDSAAILAAGATVVQTATGEPLKVPKTSAYSSAAIVAEGAQITANDPTLGSVQLDAYKYAVLVKASYELINDAAFDVAGFLAEQAGIAIGNAFGAHAVTGDGSSKPNGVLTAATAGKTGATGVTGKFSADDLIDLYHSLAEPYARSASAAWLMKNTTLAEVRKLKDSQNRYLFDINAPAGSGASGTLLGRPVYADPTMPAVALSAKSVLFGDFSRYWVRQAGPLRFEPSEHFAFDSDQVTFRALLRLDGDLIDTSGAVKYFAGGAS